MMSCTLPPLMFSFVFFFRDKNEVPVFISDECGGMGGDGWMDGWIRLMGAEEEGDEFRSSLEHEHNSQVSHNPIFSPTTPHESESIHNRKTLGILSINH